MAASKQAVENVLAGEWASNDESMNVGLTDAVDLPSPLLVGAGSKDPYTFTMSTDSAREHKVTMHTEVQRQLRESHLFQVSPQARQLTRHRDDHLNFLTPKGREIDSDSDWSNKFLGATP